ncbi:carboxypeptidase-like regulatory domain-containing protein [Nocardioides pyridinolyticus]
MRPRGVTALISSGLLLPAVLPATSALAERAGEPPHSAVTGGGWVEVSGPVSSGTQPGVARLAGSLQVVWSQTDGDGRSVRTRLLDAGGAVESPVLPVVTGWPAIIDDPKVIGPAGARRVVFAGIHPDPFSDHTGPAVFAESSDGESWTPGSGSLSQSTAAGSGSVGIAAIDAGGTPFFAKGGFSGGVIVHRGVDATVPATAPDLRATEVQGAPVDVAFARDTATDEVYVAWYSLGATDDDQAGTFVQRMWPQPNGGLLKAPGSSDGSGRSTGTGQPVALAERAGGGVWLAYLVGYPTSSTIRLWKVGTSERLTIDTGAAASHLCLTPSTAGRLWLSWRTIGDHRLHAVRTSRDVGRLGPVQHVTQPGGPSTSVWLTACEGSRGPLSLVVNAQTTAARPTIYARQVLPALSARRSPKKLDKGRVTVTVTDAGDPVAGAAVTFRGRSVTTNGRGKAVVVVRPSVKPKRYRLTVAAAGYRPTSVTIRVR